MALYQTQGQIKDVLRNRINNEGIFIDVKFTEYQGKKVIVYIFMDKELEADAPKIRAQVLASEKTKK